MDLNSKSYLEKLLHPASAGWSKPIQNIAQLEDFIAHLIHHDFERLVFILYRIDVKEHKLKMLLEKHAHEPQKIIAEEILKRMANKPPNTSNTDNWSFDVE